MNICLVEFNTGIAYTRTAQQIIMLKDRERILFQAY